MNDKQHMTLYIIEKEILLSIHMPSASDGYYTILGKPSTFIFHLFLEALYQNTKNVYITIIWDFLYYIFKMGSYDS